MTRHYLETSPLSPSTTRVFVSAIGVVCIPGGGYS
jgi:hypothetical protein